MTLFISLTFRAETNVEQKIAIQMYSEVLNTYSYTNLTSYKEIFNIVFKQGADVASICKFEPRCF